MSTKVKRGLGLLVVAVIALLIGNVLVHIGGGSGVIGGWVIPLLTIAAGLVLLVSAVGGLVLLAWGLLRD